MHYIAFLFIIVLPLALRDYCAVVLLHTHSQTGHLGTRQLEFVACPLLSLHGIFQPQSSSKLLGSFWQHSHPQLLLFPKAPGPPEEVLLWMSCLCLDTLTVESFTCLTQKREGGIFLSPFDKWRVRTSKRGSNLSELTGRLRGNSRILTQVCPDAIVLN
jgi:hypothetical protein